MADPAPAAPPNAAQQIDTAKAGALQALAEGGTAGLNAYQQAQQGMQADRASALGDVANRAALVNMGSTVPATSMVAASRIDPRVAMEGSAQASYLRRIGAEQGAYGNYFSELSGALPIITEIGRQKGLASATTAIDKLTTKMQGSDAQTRVRLLGQAQLDQQKGMTEAQQRADVAQAQIDSLRAQDEQLAKQQDAASRAAQGAQAASSGKGGGATVFDPQTGTTHFVPGASASNPGGVPQQGTAQLGPAASRSAMLARMGDIAKQRQSIQAQIDQLSGQAQQAASDQANLATGDSIVQLARAAGARMGLDPARVAGLVGPSQGAAYAGAVNRLNTLGAPVDDRVVARDAGVDPSSLGTIRGTPFYKTVRGLLDSGQLGSTYEEVSSHIQTSQAASANPRAVRVLLAEIKGLYPHAGALNAENTYLSNTGQQGG